MYTRLQENMWLWLLPKLLTFDFSNKIRLLLLEMEFYGATFVVTHADKFGAWLLQH